MDASAWARDFAGTLLLEGPLFVLLLRPALSPLKGAAAVLALNLLTHPLAWWAIASAAQPLPWRFLGVEAAVVAVEGLLLAGASRAPWFRRPLKTGEALAIALAANALSAGVGLML